MISRLISGGNSKIVCSAGTLPCDAAAALEAVTIAASARAPRKVLAGSGAAGDMASHAWRPNTSSRVTKKTERRMGKTRWIRIERDQVGESEPIQAAPQQLSLFDSILD